VSDPSIEEILRQRSLCSKCHINPRTDWNCWCGPCNYADRKRWRDENPEASRERIYRASIKRRFGLTPENVDALVDS